MYTSKLVNWLDEVDPYAIQRIVLGKTLFIATILVAVYWVFQPNNFMMFTAPILVSSFYELPTVSSLPEKERLLMFIFAATLIGSVSFYLIYPFKVIFFFYATFFMSALYFLVVKYFGELKNITMIILATLTITIGGSSAANLQVAYDMSTSAMLSMITILICLRIYPNRSLIIWRRAMRKFIACVEQDIEAAIRHQHKHLFGDEVSHLGIVRAFRRLIPKPDLRHAYRVAIYIRNIQFALDNLYFENVNEAFWRAIQHSFAQLRQSMGTRTLCPLPEPPIVAETALQQYVVKHLNKAIHRWNLLCNAHRT